MESIDGETITTTRILSGWQERLVYIIGIAMSLFHLWVNSIGVMPGIHRNAIHLGFVLTLIFLLYPAGRRYRGGRFIPLDMVLAVLGFSVGLYIFFFEEELHLVRANIPILRDYLFAVLALVLLLEGTRRSSGWFMPLLGIVFLLYATYLGQYVPGAFYYRGVTVTRLLYRMYFTDEAIFGIVTRVSSTFVFLFILFGAFLMKSGAGDFIINLARALTGRAVGGPAKVAVMASALMGSVSGSAVANTVATGSFTIPLMKRTGYKPNVAGAVEAAASTGGQLMPPVMGAGAFIMSQWTGLSYLKIISVAAIPAVMYFISVGFFVHIEALRMGIRPEREEDVPEVRKVLKEGIQFLVPVGLLMFLLIRGYTPTYAASWSILAVVATSWVRKDTRMGIKDILDALALGARNSLSTCAMLITAGIVVGVTAITGVAITFSGMILDLSQGILLLAIVLIAFASLILGMGLPVTASYIMLAVLAGPALVDLGLPLIAAHMIIFWYSQDANITPPICLAAYSASGIAGSSPMKTGLSALKLAKGLYIIPLLFAYTPILFTGSIGEVLITVVAAIAGLFCFTGLTEGYLFRETGVAERILLGAAALALFWPNNFLRALGGILFIIIFILQKRGAAPLREVGLKI